MPSDQPKPYSRSDSNTSRSLVGRILWGLIVLGVLCGGVGTLILSITVAWYAPEIVAELPRLADGLFELADSMEGISLG